LRPDYLIKLADLLKRVRPRLASGHHLEFKNCFGAVAGYVNGNIFVSCGNFGLALRLPSQALTELFREAGVSHLKYFTKGHVKREYAVIPSRIIRNRARFKQLVNKSIKFALSAEH
jgi:TfoX/Sxy family transcriptional regulator of competence genes